MICAEFSEWILILTYLGCYTTSAQFTNPIPVFEWKQVEYKYPSPQERQNDIDNGNYIPENPFVIDVDVAYAGIANNTQFFVTTPRFKAGIPVTLGKVTNEKLNGNNLIDPFPNWNWHKNPRNCSKDRLISVFRTQIDTCGRLWVLDNGNYQDELICTPQILAFSLKDNQLVYRNEYPSSVIQCNSLLVTPIVDVSDGCDKPFVYAADCQANALVVHDVAKKSFWKISDKTMYPDPDFGVYRILGESFDLMDGILGMDINVKQPPKRLFFHAMSSNTEHVVKIADIRNQSRFADNPTSSPEIFHTYWGRRKSQSPAEAIDKQGILYFGDVNSITLNCWNTATEYGPRNIRTLSSNQTILQFTSGMKVVDCSHSLQELYIVTCRFQKVANSNINTKEVNFRVLKLPITPFVKTKCT